TRCGLLSRVRRYPAGYWHSGRSRPTPAQFPRRGRSDPRGVRGAVGECGADAERERYGSLAPLTGPDERGRQGMRTKIYPLVRTISSPITSKKQVAFLRLLNSFFRPPWG